MASSANTRTPTDRGIVAALVAGGVVLVLWPGLPRWVGATLLLGATFELRAFAGAQRLAGQRWALAARGWLPYLIVAAAFVALFWEPLLGRPPATRDHGIHYYQTRLLYEELLPSGRLWGWSEGLGAGYPFGESYPTLAYLLAGAPHALSFGLVDLRTSYAWSIVGTWGLGTFAVGGLAHAVTRTCGSSRRAADWAFCVGALLWLFDAGASRQGGWNYLVFHGVWPQMLSAVLWTLSLLLTWRAQQRPSLRRIGLAALALGASVLAHPFGMLAAATSALGWLAVLVVIDTPRTPGQLRTWAIVHAAAAAICGGTVLVFLGSATGMARSPVPWSPLGELSYELVTGTLFPTHWAWLGPLFLIGAAVVLRRGAVLGVLALVLCGGLLLLGSHESMTVLRLDLLVAGFKNLQFPRYTIELKPTFFALAGVGASTIPALIGRRNIVPSRRRAWLFALLIAPFATTFVEDLGRFKTRPVAALDTLDANPQGEHEAELLAALRTEARALPPERPLTVAFLRKHMSGGTYPVFSVTDAGGALVLDGHVPAVNFKHRIRRAPKAYDALGITHVIHDRPLGEEESTFASRLEAVGTYGAYTLERYTAGPAMDAVVVPKGAFEVAVDEAERLEADLTVAAPTRVTIRRPPHDRWRATLDGAPLELEQTKTITGLTLLAVDVPQSGRLALSYHRTPLERAMGWVAAVAIGLCFVAVGRARPLRLPLWPAVPAGAVGLGVLAALGIAVAASVLQSRNLDRTWRHLAAAVAYRDAPQLRAGEDEPPRDQQPVFIRDLADDNALRLAREPARVCNGLMGKDVLPGCSEAEHAPTDATLYRAPYLYRCVEFGVPPGGLVEIQLGDGSHDVAGVLVRRLLGSSGKRLSFGAGSKLRTLRTDKVDFFISASDPDAKPRAALRNGGREVERFCLAAAEVGPPVARSTNP